MALPEWKAGHASAIQYSDQAHCPVCRVTWDINDDAPPEARCTAREIPRDDSERRPRRAPAAYLAFVRSRPK